MKAELMDKEVLCVYDIRAIQNYIFANNNNIDIIGAGEYVKGVHREALEYALARPECGLNEDECVLDEWEKPDDIPFFHNKHIKAQLFAIGGGNAFMIFRTGALADKVNKIYTRYVLESSYSLQVAIAAVERTDNFSADINMIYDELVRIKNTQPFFHPLGALPIVEKEKCTGNPVYSIDPDTGEHISLETKIKRDRARIALGDDARSGMSAIGRYHIRLAYIHIDGNGMGLAIGKIFSGITDYEEGIRAHRKLDRSILTQYLASLDEAEKKLLEVMLSDGIPKRFFSRHYQRINIGGDDINVVCNPRYAFRFVSIFVNIVKNKYLWDDGRGESIRFSVCAGIAFVHSDIEYCKGYQLAEKCCNEAKKEAKKPCNSINGEVGNWLDYQFVNDNRMEDISTQRNRDYRSNSSNLCLRPYCLDPEREGTVTHINHMWTIYRAFETYFPTTLKGRLLDCLAEDPAMVRYGLDHIILKMRGDERALVEKYLLPVIGEPMVRVEGREGEYANWYDALELGMIYDWDKLKNAELSQLG